MARPKRFELLTPRFVVWCSIQLSYGRLCFLIDEGTREVNSGSPVQVGAAQLASAAPSVPIVLDRARARISPKDMAPRRESIDDIHSLPLGVVCVPIAAMAVAGHSNRISRRIGQRE
jgi:hypothetical protein